MAFTEQQKQKRRIWEKHFQERHPIRKAYLDSVGNMRKSGEVMSIDEFEQWWKDTEVFEQRGSYRGQYQMRRNDTELGYTLDNVFLFRLGQKKQT